MNLLARVIELAHMYVLAGSPVYAMRMLYKNLGMSNVDAKALIDAWKR